MRFVKTARAYSSFQNSQKNWRRDDDDDGSRDLKLRVVRSIFRVVRGAQNESRSQWCKNQFLSAGVVFEK